MLQTSEEPKGGEGGQVVVIVVIRRIRIQIWEVVTAVRVVAARFVAHVSAYVWKTSQWKEGRGEKRVADRIEVCFGKDLVKSGENVCNIIFFLPPNQGPDQGSG